MPLHIDDNIEFDYKVPFSPADGNIIGINRQNGSANIIFYQIRKASGDHIDKADVIAAILTNIEDLTKFRDAITENLEMQEKRSEP